MFRRSSSCKADSPQCVEVSMPDTDGQPVLMRNSRNPEVVVAFTDDESNTFLAGAKAGEFDA